jgi:hypothetical protein
MGCVKSVKVLKVDMERGIVKTLKNRSWLVILSLLKAAKCYWPATHVALPLMQVRSNQTFAI